MLQSDRGLTYTGEIPSGSKIVEGNWWSADYAGPPLVSFEKRIADGLGLKLGDSITVNVLGRNVTAKIANMRTVDWQNLGINFVLVFSPNAFRGAPHTHIATLTEPNSSAESDAKIIKAVADAFPSVTSVRVREALQTVGEVVTNLVLAIRASSAITLVAAMLVLGGALAAGHRHRVYDAVILKTLGATRAPPDRRLRARIPADRTCDRGVRAAGRHRRRMADRHAAHDADVRLGRPERGRRGGRRACRDDWSRPDRHAGRAEPETRARVKEFMTKCSSGFAVSRHSAARGPLRSNVLVSHMLFGSDIA